MLHHPPHHTPPSHRHTISPSQVLDLVTMASHDQDFTADFTLNLAQGSSQPGLAHPSSNTPTPALPDGEQASGSAAVTLEEADVAAVVIWFDTQFSAQRCPETPVTLSTSPHAPLTHWAQTVLPLRRPVLLRSPSSSLGAAGRPFASEIKGQLSMARNKSKHRSLDIALRYTAVLSDGSTVEDTRVYPMSVVGQD